MCALDEHRLPLGAEGHLTACYDMQVEEGHNVSEAKQRAYSARLAPFLSAEMQRAHGNASSGTICIGGIKMAGWVTHSSLQRDR